jgi:TonB family protein
MFSKCLVVVAVLGAATIAVGDNKKQEGGALLSHALELSNIRADGAPPFTLKATFRAVDGSSGTSGTYSEIWISNDKWLREVVMGNSRRLEIANGRKKWLLDQDLNPRYFDTLTSTLKMASPAKEAKLKDTVTREVDRIQASCVSFDSRFAKEIYCVDPKNNILLTREWSSKLGSKFHTTVSYTDYEKLGNHLFPKEMHYSEDGQHSLDISMSEVSPEVTSDPSRFTPPAGSLEMANCELNQMKAPYLEFGPDPPFPGKAAASNAIVVLSLIVGTDGKPHLIHVARSGGAAFDVEAIRTVQGWKFRPATCQGEQTSTMINVEVEFHGLQ